MATPVKLLWLIEDTDWYARPLTPPTLHASGCYTSLGLHEVCNVLHRYRYRLQIPVNGCRTEEVYSKREMGGVA